MCIYIYIYVYIYISHYNEDSSTPLFAAAQGGHEEVAQLLLSSQADAERTTVSGKTSLGMAARGDLGVLREAF